MNNNWIHQSEAYNDSRILEDAILSIGMFSLAAAVIYLFYLRSQDVMSVRNLKEGTNDTRLGISALNITDEWIEQDLPSPISSEDSSISSLTRSMKIFVHQDCPTNRTPDVKCQSDHRIFCDVQQVHVKENACDDKKRKKDALVCDAEESEDICDDIEKGQSIRMSSSVNGTCFDSSSLLVPEEIYNTSDEESNSDEDKTNDITCQLEGSRSLHRLQEI